MDKFMRAIYELDITVVQLNEFDPATGQMVARRFETQED